ncbi:MAG: hypothetical protein ACK53Y_25370, partial [bacterium]
TPLRLCSTRGDTIVQADVTFTPDTTAPVLDSFALNMNSGELALTFSEPVDVATLQSSGITLQTALSAGNVATTVTLDDSVSTSSSSNGLTIQYWSD